MTETARHDSWSAGQSYERYMGRWSRQIADKFLEWLPRRKTPIGSTSAPEPER